MKGFGLLFVLIRPTTPLELVPRVLLFTLQDRLLVRSLSGSQKLSGAAGPVGPEVRRFPQTSSGLIAARFHEVVTSDANRDTH